MRNTVAFGIAASVLVILPSTAYTQGAVVEPREINVDVPYRGERPDRPEPRGGRDGGEGRSAGNAPAPAVRPPVYEAVVTLGRGEYRISLTEQQVLEEFITEFQANDNVGQGVGLFAAILALFGLVSIDPESPLIEAIYNPVSTAFDANELVLTISSPAIWSNFMRAAAANRAGLRMEVLRGRRDEQSRNAFQMWQHIRNIIRFPERYQNGGIRYNRETKTLQSRGPAAASLQSITASELTPADAFELGDLTRQLLAYPPASDFVSEAQYLFYIGPWFTDLNRLMLRDELLLNRALRTVGPATRASLDNRFLINMKNPSMSPFFWNRMRGFLYSDNAWDSPRIRPFSAPPLDSLGFEEDMPCIGDVTYAEMHARPDVSASLLASLERFRC